MKKTSISIFTVFMILIFILHRDIGFAADANDVISLLDAKIKSVSITEHSPEIKITDEQLKKADPCQVLNLLGKYENDLS